MMEKMRIREVLVVEGKYDAARLQNLVDGLVLCTGGFNVFTSEETKELILRLGRVRGLCVLCLLYTSPSPRDRQKSRMPSSA